eukprot:gene476-3807_t
MLKAVVVVIGGKRINAAELSLKGSDNSSSSTTSSWDISGGIRGNCPVSEGCDFLFGLKIEGYSLANYGCGRAAAPVSSCLGVLRIPPLYFNLSKVLVFQKTFIPDYREIVLRRFHILDDHHFDSCNKEDEPKIFDIPQRSFKILSQLESLDQMRTHLDRLSEIAQQLHERIKATASSASQVSAQVKELDELKQRISDDLDRATDIVDLKECYEGTQEALAHKDYEKAALFLHRYLSLGPDIVASNPDKRLEQAKTELLGHLRDQCQKACDTDDDESFKRWLKYFAMIHAHSEGLQQCVGFLRHRIINHQNDLNLQHSNENNDDTQFVNRIKRLLNYIALEVEGFLGCIDTHFGPGYTLFLLSQLQSTVDTCALAIVDEFVLYRQLKDKASNLESDHRDIDTLTSELAMLIQPIAYFLRFVELRAEADRSALEEIRRNEGYDCGFQGPIPLVCKEIPDVRRNSKLSCKTDELNAMYVILEDNFLTSSVTVAIQEDELDLSQQIPVTKAVEDVLFLCNKCTRRAFLTVSEVNVSSTLNHVGTCLIDRLLAYLETRAMKAQLHRLDGASWSETFHKGLALASGESDKAESTASLPRHVWINNLQMFKELLPKYKSDTLDYYNLLSKRISTREHEKILTVVENNIQEALDVAHRYLEIGVDTLASESISSKLRGLVTVLPYASFELNEEEFDGMPDLTQQMAELLGEIETTIQHHKSALLPGAFTAWAVSFTEKVVELLEGRVATGKYNLLGGLQLEKDISRASSCISDVVGWPMTDRFHRLNRICLLLTLDQIHSVYDYYDTAASNWHLSRDEITTILLCRTDFSPQDVARLKL